MAPDTTSHRLLKKKNLPYFELNVYSEIAVSDLVVYSVFSLQKQGSEISTENVVFTCFGLFPHKFSLKNYTRWPDSALVARRLSDCKDRGTIKGNSTEGFLLTYKGLKLAERVARELGVYVPEKKPVKKTVSVAPQKPTKKKLEAPKKEIKKTSHKQEKKQVPPVVVEKTAFKQLVKVQMKKVQPETPDKKVLSQKIKHEEVSKVKVEKVRAKAVKKLPSKPIVKQAQTSHTTSKLSVQPVEKKLQPQLLPEKLIAPKVVKQKVEKPKAPEQAPVQIKKKNSEPVKKKGESTVVNSKPVMQLQLIPAVEKQPKPTPPKKAVVKPPPTVAVVVAVSKEEKARAAKFIQSMERSDAYRHYLKDGVKARINEFDFRSLLLCTMESSAETLVRNLNLFKGYANIQNRQDLITFLNFCEKSFSTLLNSAG
ncbi:MAG: hypothetical protein U0Z26_03665, partial [Anaerolineales bacterium]